MPSLYRYWIILRKVLITTALLRANTLKTKINKYVYKYLLCMTLIVVGFISKIPKDGKRDLGFKSIHISYLKGLVFINANISVNSQNHTA